MNSRLNDFVALDMEVTGEDPKKDRIIKFDAVRFSDGLLPTKRFRELCNPGIQLSEMTQTMSGISNSELKKARPTEIVQDAFFQFLGGSTLVIHLASFDMNFISAECDRSNIDRFANTVVDTLKLARVVCKNANNFKLETLSKLAKLSTTEPVCYQVGHLWVFLQDKARKLRIDPMLAVTRDGEKVMSWAM
jgi:DNA polymerase III alpha subunit (gram-positive type)